MFFWFNICAHTIVLGETLIIFETCLFEAG